MHKTAKYRTIPIRVFEPPLVAPPSIINLWIHGTSQNPLIRKIHASPKGITPLEELGSDWGLKGVGKELAAHDNAQFPEHGFFTFGWSGKLSHKARREAGAELNTALRSLVDTHRARFGITPRIRIIAHSHGCNVALNASLFFNESDSPLVIDELVLLACPVQQATAHLIASPVFSNIYALYSTRDILQVLDPQGLRFNRGERGTKLFSSRVFPARANLVQAQIRWRGVGLSHAGFIRKRFGRALPSILEYLRQEREDCIISVVQSVIDFDK